MLLIFPSIEILSGQCVQPVQDEESLRGTYSLDPLQMAVLWRGENAKTLHVIDLDGVRKGALCNLETIRKMVEAVDVPIQVAGGIRHTDDVRSLCAAGVFRVVIGTASVENPEIIEKSVAEFGARRIAVSIESWAGELRIEGGAKKAPISPTEHAIRMKKMGISRIIFSSVDPETGLKRFDFEGLKSFAETTGLRVTAQGGISKYQELIRLQELEKTGVDSVILGKALYENRFPCQRIWRMNERILDDLGPTRRI